MSDWIFYEEHHTMRCPYCETIHADHIARRYCPMCGNYMHDEEWDAIWKAEYEEELWQQSK